MSSSREAGITVNWKGIAVVADPDDEPKKLVIEKPLEELATA